MFGLKRKLQRNSLSRDLRIFILAIGVIMIWRGVWNLIDHYLIPEYWVFSSILSVVIGVIILVLNDNNLTELAGDE
jgi:hypothetical protein